MANETKKTERKLPAKIIQKAGGEDELRRVELPLTERKLSAKIIQKAGGEDKLRRVELPLDDLGAEHLEVIVVVPNRRILGQYLKYQNVNPNKAQEILVKNCVLTDLEQVMDDDNLFMTAVGCIADLIPIREGIIKKY